jgi:hypothetical protein
VIKVRDVALIFSFCSVDAANLDRRNLSKGQQAMGRALIYPEPEDLLESGRSTISDKALALVENLEIKPYCNSAVP